MGNHSLIQRILLTQGLNPGLLYCRQILGGSVVKNPPANPGDIRDSGFDPWGRKIPWSREWQPAPVFLPGKFHGQRSLAGYSPWGCKEWDMTEHAHICSALKTNCYFILSVTWAPNNIQGSLGNVGTTGWMPLSLPVYVSFVKYKINMIFKKILFFYVDSLIFLQSCILFLFIISYFSPSLKFYVFLSFCVFRSFCFVLITTNKKQFGRDSRSEKSSQHLRSLEATVFLPQLPPWDWVCWFFRKSHPGMRRGSTAQPPRGFDSLL